LNSKTTLEVRVSIKIVLQFCLIIKSVNQYNKIKLLTIKMGLVREVLIYLEFVKFIVSHIFKRTNIYVDRLVSID